MILKWKDAPPAASINFTRNFSLEIFQCASPLPPTHGKYNNIFEVESPRRWSGNTSSYYSDSPCKIRMEAINIEAFIMGNPIWNLDRFSHYWVTRGQVLYHRPPLQRTACISPWKVDSFDEKDLDFPMVLLSYAEKNLRFLGIWYHIQKNEMLNQLGIYTNPFHQIIICTNRTWNFYYSYFEIQV